MGCRTEPAGSTEPEDCAGVADGIAVEDDCGVCNGDNSTCADCAGTPNGNSTTDNCGTCDDDDDNDCQNCSAHIDYNVSTLQAFYYFTDVRINGENIDELDWVGAYNGDICVGARQWDTNQCGSGVCDVPTLGNDGSQWTSGYMQNGEIPIFKIYDVSENIIYNTTTSADIPSWSNGGFTIIESTLEAITVSEVSCQ